MLYIKARFKLIRKHDCDFWNVTYYRVAQNRFFWYYKHSLIYRMKSMGHRREFKLMSRRTLKIASLQGHYKERSYYNPFLNKKDRTFLNVKRNINFYKLFLRRGLRFVTYIYRRCFYYKAAYANDLLLGVKSAFRIYRPIKHNPFVAKKMFFQRLSLYFNNFNLKRLRRFGRLGRKGQFGGVNFFLLLLESRIDSIVLRFNLGSKFVMRDLVLSGKILVGGKVRTYPNYIVKKGVFVTFIPKIRALVYKVLLHRIPRKMFFVQPPFYFEINYRTLMILIVPKLMDPTFVPFPFIKSQSSLLAGLHTVLWGW